MAIEEGKFKTRIELVENYKFRISFDNEKASDLFMDEPKPLGEGEYANAGKLLAAAVGNCLCASLAFCIRRHHAEVLSITADVSTTMARNENERLRITHISVDIHPEVSDPAKLEKCRAIFEDFCIVTESVKAGIHVDVKVDGNNNQV